MTLYSKLKPHLPPAQAFISDEESLLLNRRDYHVSQISSVNAVLNCLGTNVGYPYRVLLAFLDQFSGGMAKADFNIVLSDPSLTVAALIVWIRAGGGDGRGKVYAPKGVGRMAPVSSLLGEMLADFAAHCDTRPDSRPPGDRLSLFTFVLGNTKTSAQTIFAADRYAEVPKGLLILKDYARVGAFDERDYVEGKQIFPAVTFEGHAFALKM